jgi:hypothetical protein
MFNTRITLVVGAAMVALSTLTTSASAQVLEALTAGASGTLPLLAAGLGLWALAEKRKFRDKKSKRKF